MGATQTQLPVPTNVQARYMGPVVLSGATTYYYWVQAIYPSGYSELSAAGSAANAPSSLSPTQLVNVEWDPMNFVLGFNLFRSTSSTTPTQGLILLAAGLTQPNFKDVGAVSTVQSTIKYDGLKSAKAVYNFAVDGGAISTLTPSQSDWIPINAVILGGFIQVDVSFAPTTTSTIAVGTTAGSSSSSILAATLGSALVAGTFVAIKELWTAATIIQMTAAGQINVTIASGAFTAGVMEIIVFYTVTNAQY